MATESSGSGSGIGFIGLLTIAFIVLKLTGFIQWPWVWVLSPLWISGILIGLVLICILAIIAVQSWRAS